MRFRTALAACAAALLAGCGGGSTDGSAARDLTVGESTPYGPKQSKPTDEAGGGGGGKAGGGGGKSGRGGDGGSALTKASFASAVTKAQLVARTAHLSGDISSGGLSVRLEGDVRVGEDPADYAMDLTMSSTGLSDGTIRMILVDEALYMNLGEATRDKFAKLDFANPSNPMEANFTRLLNSADPSASVDAMAESLRSFDEVGTETIDGVQTTQYRLEVDTAKLLTAQDLGDMADAAAQTLPKTLRYHVWIDQDDLVRRMSFSMSSLMSMTMDITDWGEPVEISAPPPGQVTNQEPFAGMPTG